MAETFVRTVQGFELFGLRNDRVELAVMPELGAKVAGLRNLRSGREWMWTPPQGAHFRAVPTGTPFDQSSLVGADECLPTIGPCTWRGVELPDHGEAWSAAWDLDRLAFVHGQIVTRVQLQRAPFWVERSIALEGNVITVDYALRNLETAPHEFMWAFHPLFAPNEGDQLLLPPDCHWVRCEVAFNCPLGQRGDRWRWPLPVEGIYLDRLDLGREDAAVKLFTEPLTTGWATIRNDRTGDELRYSFDVGTVDTLGIWINRGGWNGYHHLAVEPGIGAPDPLDVAVNDWKRFAVAKPGATFRWSFTMTLAP
jgi:galactose mutarotase-like enzyme